jgi:hypothetical protein
MRRIGKFFELPLSDKLLLLRAWTTLLLMRAAVLAIPLARLRRAVARRSAEQKGSSVGLPSAEKIAWALAAMSCAVPGGENCLVRALATQRMLSRAGCDSDLKFGVAGSGPGKIQAHAWVESRGKIIMGEFPPRAFVVMAASGTDGSTRNR